jgi:uncharacterized protein YaaW (UPF0174 family)
MWEQQQSVAASADGEKKEKISSLQKAFLEELGKESDVNGAAAKALKALLSSSPVSTSASSEPVSPVHFTNLSDDDDVDITDQNLDEFDLWDHQRASGYAPQSEEKKEALGSFQRLFLDQLKEEKDVNGAAAESLKKLFASMQSIYYTQTQST